MALTACVRCGGRLSTWAAKCPHCGDTTLFRATSGPSPSGSSSTLANPREGSRLPAESDSSTLQVKPEREKSPTRDALVEPDKDEPARPQHQASASLGTPPPDRSPRLSRNILLWRTGLIGVGLAVALSVAYLMGRAAGPRASTEADSSVAIRDLPRSGVENLEPPQYPAASPPASEFYSLPSPSFDCNQGLSTDEATICNDPALPFLDVQLDSLYGEATSGMGNLDSLRSTQRAWLELRRACSTLPMAARRQCIQDSYEKRIVELQAYLVR